MSNLQAKSCEPDKPAMQQPPGLRIG